MARSFNELSTREILALAITQEEEDGRIYGDYADRLRGEYPDSADALMKMMEEESTHRHRLIDLYKTRFGDHIPLIRRQDVKGFVERRPLWLSKVITLKQVWRDVEVTELQTRRFYEAAAQLSTDAEVRQLLGDLAREESKHSDLAEALENQQIESGARASEEETSRRIFVLQVVQPGLAGLMDGSVSTLSPLFAAAFATKNSWDAFLVGIAASIGAGISMGFAEALSDDGAISGRGRPWIRGLVCGLMTTLGGLGHTLPYLIHDFQIATSVAVVVVVVELAIISWIRNHYMDTPLLSAIFQVVLGGVLVFLTGVLIGSA
jgi:erythrin-vacuolar iron transport family protein